MRKRLESVSSRWRRGGRRTRRLREPGALGELEVHEPVEQGGDDVRRVLLRFHGSDYALRVRTEKVPEPLDDPLFRDVLARGPDEVVRLLVVEGLGERSQGPLLNRVDSLDGRWIQHDVGGGESFVAGRIHDGPQREDADR